MSAYEPVNTVLAQALSWKQATYCPRPYKQPINRPSKLVSIDYDRASIDEHLWGDMRIGGLGV